MASSGSVTMEARKLLQALCRFIIPLVQSTADWEAIGDGKEIPLGPEADECIIQLEKFVSSVQQGNRECGIDVPLRENKEQSALVAPQSQLPQSIVPADLKEDLRVLQSSITGDMPIRLLSFEPSDSHLKISLLDQAAIYHYLASKVEAEFYEKGYVDIKKYTEYAILSHTWTQTPGELTYRDWYTGGLNVDNPKCRKLLDFARAAWKDHKLAFGWIDSICIDKDSSSELDESIRSMYKWYSKAKICITYLAETNSILDMDVDPWFTRGWTLQELVAPRFIKFYNKDWQRLIPSGNINDKKNQAILRAIESATTINGDELRNINEASLSRRMELAAKRNVTREEDTAYSLMGIFNVSISTAYGEGAQRAFFRLLKEIFDSTEYVSDIFNWARDAPFDLIALPWDDLDEREIGSIYPLITSLFPPRPFGYVARSTDPHLRSWHPIEPLTLTHWGLRIPILLMTTSFSYSQTVPVGDYSATVSFQRVSWHIGVHQREICYLLQRSSNQLNLDPWFTTTIGVLNVEAHDDGASIRIPKTCFAVLLEDYGSNKVSGRYRRKLTYDPIVFALEKHGEDDEDKDYYVVAKAQLQNHGMELVTLYL